MVGPFPLKKLYQSTKSSEILDNSLNLKMALLKTKCRYLSHGNQEHHLQGHHQKFPGHPPHSQYHLQEKNFIIRIKFLNVANILPMTKNKNPQSDVLLVHVILKCSRILFNQKSDETQPSHRFSESKPKDIQLTLTQLGS